MDRNHVLNQSLTQLIDVLGTKALALGNEHQHNLINQLVKVKMWLDTV